MHTLLTLPDRMWRFRGFPKPLECEDLYESRGNGKGPLEVTYIGLTWEAAVQLQGLSDKYVCIVPNIGLSTASRMSYCATGPSQHEND